MDVVVVGGCMTDLTSYMPYFPRPGETLHGHKFNIGFGGKGANQCVMAARLGANTAMVAKVGSDTFGQDYIQNFKDNNVNTEHVAITTEAATGVATISVNDEGQNAITVVSGANLLLSTQDVQNAESLIASAKVVVCQFEINREVSLAALKLARQHSVLTILNTAPARSNLASEYFTFSDILCANEGEAERLTGVTVHSVTDAHAAVTALLQLGCRTAIVTLGSQGAVFASQESTQPVHVPAQHVNVVDTTGAGDAVVGALAFYLSRYPSLSLREMIKRSVDIATVTVQLPGTQASYPRLGELPADLFSSQLPTT